MMGPRSLSACTWKRRIPSRSAGRRAAPGSAERALTVVAAAAADLPTAPTASVPARRVPSLVKASRLQGPIVALPSGDGRVPGTWLQSLIDPRSDQDD